MALAAFKLLKCTGTNAATEADCSKHPCFLSADLNSTATTTYPIAIPADADSATGDSYSYENWLRLECTSVPDNYCQTFKVYGPSTQPDDPTNKLTVMIGTTDTGVTPTANASSVATTIQHTNYYSAATGLSIGVEPSDNQIAAVGEKTDYVVLQLQVEYEAEQGDISTVVGNWSYEEV